MDFDSKSVCEEIVLWIKNWFLKNGKDCNAIVGISGGKDSSVVAALCVRALGTDRVIGVLMPNGEQHDIDMAKLLVNHLKIESVVINIKDAYNGIYNSAKDGLGEISDQARINLAPRIRMAALYAVSQSRNGRVANTCNLSEDYVGYATKYGDGAGDFSPLSQLTVTEVRSIGRVLGLPNELVDKVPIDGLCGKTDEENLGFSYECLDKYIREGICPDEKIKEKIDKLHKQNLFKLMPMEYFSLKN